jgi:chitosanase
MAHVRNAPGAAAKATVLAVLALSTVPVTTADQPVTTADTSRTSTAATRDDTGNPASNGSDLPVKVFRRKAGPIPAPGVPVNTRSDLAEPHRKDVAMRLVSSAENSSLDWRAQYGYIEDIGDGRGYTAGIIGFCSGTSDMLELVEAYTAAAPGNVLARFLPALRAVNGTASHAGLGSALVAAWRIAAADPAFQRAQDSERDRVYFNPAVASAKADGLRALGQFIYYDAIVMHGPGSNPVSFGGIRATAMTRARTPAQGGDEATYLHAFLDARTAAMRTEDAHSDTSRIDTAQRVFLTSGNLDLNMPLAWKVYGDHFSIPA